jgi:ComF family protein
MGRFSIGRALVDAIWPPRSLLSQRLVDRPGAMLAKEWARLKFLGPPWCACCGFPFEFQVDPGALCGACTAEAPAFATARAPLAYDEASRPLILEVKHAGRRDGLATFAAWMACAGADQLAQAQCLAPVPLHWRRLASRRFNQSAWLAQALGKQCGVPVHVDALIRIKPTKSQAGANPGQRRRNVSGAFKARPIVRGKTLVLVDDVYTTGATVAAVTRAALKAGATKVHVLTLARVVRPLDVSI